MDSELRTQFLDPDFRRTPKTNHYCCVCYKDIKPTAQYRVAVVLENCLALHPDDWDRYELKRHEGKMPIGMDCARKVGLEWSIERTRT